MPDPDNTAPEGAATDTAAAAPMPAAAPLAPPPAPAAKPALVTAVPPPVVVDDPTAFAVLTTPRGGLVAGQVVFAAGSEIAALIAAGEGRAPATGELDRAQPFHFALPPADAPDSEA